LVTVIDLSIRTSGRPRFRVVSDHRPPYRHPLWYKSPKQLSAVPSVECPSDRQLLERSSPDAECPDLHPEQSSTDDRYREYAWQGFVRIEHLPGVLFTILGPGDRQFGDFLQKIDSGWVDVEHFWQFCSQLPRTHVFDCLIAVTHLCVQTCCSRVEHRRTKLWLSLYRG